MALRNQRQQQPPLARAGKSHCLNGMPALTGFKLGVVCITCGLWTKRRNEEESIDWETKGVRKGLEIYSTIWPKERVTVWMRNVPNTRHSALHLQDLLLHHLIFLNTGTRIFRREKIVLWHSTSRVWSGKREMLLLSLIVNQFFCTVQSVCSITIMMKWSRLFAWGPVEKRLLHQARCLLSQSSKSGRPDVLSLLLDSLIYFPGQRHRAQTLHISEMTH